MAKTSVGHRESGLCYCLTTGGLQMSLLLSSSGPREPLGSVAGLLQVQKTPKSHMIVQCPTALLQELELHNLVYIIFINLLIQHSLLFILTNHFYTSAEELIKNERPFPGSCIEHLTRWHSSGNGWEDAGNEDQDEHGGTGWAVWVQEMMGSLYCHYSYWLYYDIGKKSGHLLSRSCSSGSGRDALEPTVAYPWSLFTCNWIQSIDGFLVPVQNKDVAGHASMSQAYLLWQCQACLSEFTWRI